MYFVDFEGDILSVDFAKVLYPESLCCYKGRYWMLGKYAFNNLQEAITNSKSIIGENYKRRSHALQDATLAFIEAKKLLDETKVRFENDPVIKKIS